MASNAATTPPASPLGSMNKLSPCVYIYRPETPSPAAPSTTGAIPTPKPPPKLIVLATWMGARDPHIAKYLVQYQALYPTAPILLLRSEARHFVRPRGNPRVFAPAVPFVRAVFPELGSRTRSIGPQQPEGRQPELLLHAWSNGGASSLHHLRAALALDLSQSTSPAQLALPRYTLVLDSSPGTFRYGAGFRAFTAGLSGLALWLAAPFMHALCLMYWVQHVLFGRGRTGPLATVAKGLNDDLSKRGEVRRTYVYGERDRLVDWRDVEGHAEDAEEKGFKVRREKFEGGEHVAHVRVDGGRYWRVVRETWEGTQTALVDGQLCPPSPWLTQTQLSRKPPVPPFPGNAPAIIIILVIRLGRDLVTPVPVPALGQPLSAEPGVLLGGTPAAGAGNLERLDCVVHTAIVALVGLELGRARVALLVVLLLVRQRALLAHAEGAVVLRLEAAELLRKLLPGEGVAAMRAGPLEDDEPAHGGFSGPDGPHGTRSPCHDLLTR
ncbi:hypothetical protein C8A01DRAFT_48471 [Parachaetomium inaequale]|uniref:Indole-diterpene biosynthesis protein PaxU n=1 Tax=Parachaetomium inaequale TaxID=2588326 RepID=A0AAN6SPU9_9PEZI|nr:hypothetical protein C8A01DRAFT_48471 [Parachaetomium inaequale]